MAVSFRVADVARAIEPLREWPLRRAAHDLLKTPVEACGAVANSLVPAAKNAFLTAAWLAFSGHRPLVWSPDAVWLCIAQGFALHVNAHAEDLRGRFVRHAGRALTPDVSGDLLREHGEHLRPRVVRRARDEVVPLDAQPGRLIKLVNLPRYRELSPKQIIPMLATRGIYIASEATLYRILKKYGQQHHRSRARPPSRRPRALTAHGPFSSCGSSLL